VRLFVYGTLLDANQLRAVTGRTFPSRPARLEGWRRVRPRGGWPDVVRDPGAHVDGALLDGIDAQALAALDAYEDEGRLYRREDASVTADGAPVPCQLYRRAVSRRPARRRGGTRRRASGA
jgi:gamma-glutamylcyclotransferase (GGCT)/AIG2-like uncharacterized protein YtfP